MREGKFAWPSLNANWARICGKISRITLWAFDLRLGRGVSPNFQPRWISLRLRQCIRPFESALHNKDITIRKSSTTAPEVIGWLRLYSFATSGDRYICCATPLKGGSRTGAPGAPPPPSPRFEKFGGGGCKFWLYSTFTLILVNMPCLQYVFYSQLYYKG